MMDLSKVDTLVFAGAGTAGVAYASLLRKMINARYIDMTEIRSFVGASAGVMLVALLSAGFSPR